MLKPLGHLRLDQNVAIGFSLFFVSLYADLAKLTSSTVVRSPDQSAKVVSSKI